MMKSGIDGWNMFFNNIEYILPISICFVLLIYYLDKKNKSKKERFNPIIHFVKDKYKVLIDLFKNDKDNKE